MKTPQGLRVEGYAGRAGVYRYARQDGTTRLELRPESEVFSTEALIGFEGAVVTNDHPGALVAADQSLRAKHGKGTVTAARRDGDKVAITSTITDPATIAAIESGRRELSPGYTIELDETPGTDPKFGRYDAVQRSIRIDHLALVDRARGGRECALRLDGDDAEIRLDDDKNATRSTMKTDPEQKKNDVAGGAETIDALRAERDEAVSKANRMDAENVALKAELDKTKADLAAGAAAAESDAITSERAARKDAEDKLALVEGSFEERVQKAAELRVRAKALCPDIRTDSESDDAIVTGVLKRLTPKEPFQSKDAEWRRVRMDQLVELRAASHQERDQIARAVRTDTVEERSDNAKPKWGDSWKAGPPATTALNKKGR